MKSHIIGPQLPKGDQVLSLGDQIRAYAEVVGRRVDHVHRNLGILLFTAIVYDTPVDSGLARGSWFPSKGAPRTGGSQRIDPTGAVVTRHIQEVCMSAKVSDILFFMNNVHYIGELEYGWSKQSPEGMVRINVARIRRMLKDVVASAQEVK